MADIGEQFKAFGQQFSDEWKYQQFLASVYGDWLLGLGYRAMTSFTRTPLYNWWLRNGKPTNASGYRKEFPKLKEMAQEEADLAKSLSEYGVELNPDNPQQIALPDGRVATLSWWQGLTDGQKMQVTGGRVIGGVVYTPDGRAVTAGSLGLSGDATTADVLRSLPTKEPDEPTFDPNAMTDFQAEQVARWERQDALQAQQFQAQLAQQRAEEQRAADISGLTAARQRGEAFRQRLGARKDMYAREEWEKRAEQEEAQLEQNIAGARNWVERAQAQGQRQAWQRPQLRLTDEERYKELEAERKALLNMRKEIMEEVDPSNISGSMLRIFPDAGEAEAILDQIDATLDANRVQRFNIDARRTGLVQQAAPGFLEGANLSAGAAEAMAGRFAFNPQSTEFAKFTPKGRDALTNIGRVAGVTSMGGGGGLPTPEFKGVEFPNWLRPFTGGYKGKYIPGTGTTRGTAPQLGIPSGRQLASILPTQREQLIGYGQFTGRNWADVAQLGRRQIPQNLRLGRTFRTARQWA